MNGGKTAHEREKKMKVKTNKIYGIDKSICCAEQKIAYNIAHSWSDIVKAALEKCYTEVQKHEIVFEAIQKSLKNFEETYGAEKYNIDAIFIALNQGMRKYCEKPFIAFSYESIGKAFPIPYERI